MFIALIAVLILSVFALTVRTDFHWIVHALMGTSSLLLSLFAAVSGVARAGRIRMVNGASLIGAHQKIAIYLDFFVVCSFLLGLWSRLYMGELPFWLVARPLDVVVHGWFGLTVMIFAIAQILACFLLKRRILPRRIHKFFGYPVTLLVIIQTVLGLYAALV